MNKEKQSNAVFFTGIPSTVDADQLRRHFDSVGHTIDFRLFGPNPGKNFRFGVATYLDERTANDAITRLNGTVLADKAIKVTVAMKRSGVGNNNNTNSGGGSHTHYNYNVRKRRRDDFRHGNNNTHDHRNRNSYSGPNNITTTTNNNSLLFLTKDESAEEVYAANAVRDAMSFPRHAVDPLLRSAHSPILECLRRFSTETAYEAVEQLRVLAMERPEAAQELLQTNPALRSAVILILQHANKLPYGQLPPEAYASSTELKEESQKSNNMNSSDNNNAVSSTSIATSLLSSSERPRFVQPPTSLPTTTTAAPPPVTNRTTESVSPSEITSSQRDEVLKLISQMSEGDVERVLAITHDELNAIADPMQRRQLQILQARLKEMTQGL